MAFTVAEFKAGETVFRQGETGQVMYLVQSGEVAVIQVMGDAETQVAVLTRTDFFGEMSILESEPRTHTVRALSDAKLVQIDAKGLKNLLLRNPDITARMVRKLSGRLEKTQDMLIRAYASAKQLGGGGETAAVVSGNAHLIAVPNDVKIPLPDQPEIHIGRLDPVNGIHPDVDLTQLDTQISTSRRHAVILRRADAFFIREEQATNGTIVNGQRISSQHPILLCSGDEILFGGVRMRFAVD